MHSWDRMLNKSNWPGVGESMLVETLTRIESDGHTPLAVFRYGSHLYGTANQSSDNDYHIIFFPGVEWLTAGKKIPSYRASTGGVHEKNKPGDVDIQASDIREVLKRFSRGEMVAIDLMFAPTNGGSVLYMHGAYRIWWKNVVGRIRVGDLSGVLGYMNNQASKYGLKGTRLGVAKQIVKSLRDFLNISPDASVGAWVSFLFFGNKGENRDIIESPFVNETTVDMISKGGKKVEVKAIEALGKKFSYNTPAISLLESMVNVVERYGHRAELAEKNEGIDWKALSHAYRAAIEYIELRRTGMVRFPLGDSDIAVIKKIKSGELHFCEASELIEKKIVEVNALRQDDTPPSRRITEVDSDEAAFDLFLTLASLAGPEFFNYSVGSFSGARVNSTIPCPECRGCNSEDCGTCHGSGKINAHTPVDHLLFMHHNELILKEEC